MRDEPARAAVPIGMQVLCKPGDVETVFRVGHGYSRGGIKLYTGELMPNNR